MAVARHSCFASATHRLRAPWASPVPSSIPFPACRALRPQQSLQRGRHNPRLLVPSRRSTRSASALRVSWGSITSLSLRPVGRSVYASPRSLPRATQDLIPVGWLGLDGEGIPPSGQMWLRLDARPFPSTGVTPLPRYFGPLRLPLRSCPLHGDTAYRARRSQAIPEMAPQGSHCWGGDGSLLFPRWLSHRSTPSTPQGSSGLHSKLLTPSMAFASGHQARLPVDPLRGKSFRRGRLHLMLRTDELHPPKEGLTPR